MNEQGSKEQTDKLIYSNNAKISNIQYLNSAFRTNLRDVKMKI